MFDKLKKYLLGRMEGAFIRNKISSYRITAKHFGTNITLAYPLTIEGVQEVSIGDDTAIGTYVHIWGYGGVTIGQRVQIATHASIISVTHDYNSNEMHKTSLLQPVIIEDDVWIGANAIILPGVTLGKGCVVGAGSVVTKNVPPLAIVVGNPAKVSKYRNIVTD